MNPWILIILSAILDIGWGYTLPLLSEMYTKPVYTALNLIFLIGSMYLMTEALKKLPLGTAYAVEVAIGSLGIVIIGMLFLRESRSLLRIIFLLIVIFGVIGLKFTTP
ncbi:MAG: QacE family quaternary ammonium compound efflux SMR transporter [Methanobrevibacter sp.]|jgi:quaternary ammonium compound-resistance protein SugE|nr:QacE family quaternary ammonium compound efflux SMR transporter [Candidatus Methanovirga procula]